MNINDWASEKLTHRFLGLSKDDFEGVQVDVTYDNSDSETFYIHAQMKHDGEYFDYSPSLREHNDGALPPTRSFHAGDPINMVILLKSK